MTVAMGTEPRSGLVEGEPVTVVPLPEGRSWFRRIAPEPARFQEWCGALVHFAEHPDDPEARSVERVKLIAAYDAGWDVLDAGGHPVPPPCALDLAGWNRVPPAAIGAILDHVDGEADSGLRAAADQRAAEGGPGA